VLAAIPYTTFPELPFGLNTFGLTLVVGALVGARLAAGYGQRFGIAREDTYRVATVMVLAGIVGSRLSWVVTHTDQVDDPLDAAAVWEGGLPFAGGFVVAVLAGLPTLRRWGRAQRWHAVGGYAWGLTLALAIGQVGCYAVGEHFGGTTRFVFGTRYDGGTTREVCLAGDPAQACAGGVPLREGLVFHNTALYELAWLLGLFLLMTAIVWRARHKGREVRPVTLAALFAVTYGVARFLTDTLRVNDERLLSMTGAQWLCIPLTLTGIWLWFRTRPALRKLVDESGRIPVPVDGTIAGLLADDPDDEEEPVAPDELAPPEDVDHQPVDG